MAGGSGDEGELEADLYGLVAVTRADWDIVRSVLDDVNNETFVLHDRDGGVYICGACSATAPAFRYEHDMVRMQHDPNCPVTLLRRVYDKLPR
jgi:hypothetical protein